MNEDVDFSKLTDDKLQDELNRCLDKYEHWINQKYVLDSYSDEEVFVMISMRDDIHDLIHEIRRRKLDVSFSSRLFSLDRQWQSWIITHHDKSYTFIMDRDDQPRSKWWWWIDQLETLSDEDRVTV